MIKDLFAKLLPPPPSAADISAAQIDAWFYQLLPLFRQMQVAPLDAAQNRRLGQYLFLEGPLLVHLVVEAMRRDPRFYEHCPPGLADEMARSLSCARRWTSLHHLFSRLARVSESQRVLGQAAAVRSALAVLEDVQAQARRPFGDKDMAQERLDVLEAAVLVLERARRRMGGKRR